MISLEIPISELRFYDVISKTLMVEEGCYEIAVDPSSGQFMQQTRIQLPRKKTVLRDMAVRTAADHYDASENICLTEGQFGYTSAVTLKKEKARVLVYRDCKILPEQKNIILHMNSEEGGRTEVFVNGKKVAGFEEKTGLYKDVWLKLACEGTDFAKPAVLEIRLNEKVNLCYFRLE